MRDREKEQKLIDALNLICGYASVSLPFGWDIELTMNSGETSIELIDPSGEEVQCDSESGVSILSIMCETANDIERDRTINR